MPALPGAVRSRARCCFFPSPSSSVLPHLPAPFLLISALSFCVHPPFLARSLFSTWGPGIRKLSEGREAWWPGVTGVAADGGPRGPLPPPAVNDSNLFINSSQEPHYQVCTRGRFQLRRSRNRREPIWPQDFRWTHTKYTYVFEWRPQRGRTLGVRGSEGSG